MEKHGAVEYWAGPQGRACARRGPPETTPAPQFDPQGTTQGQAAPLQREGVEVAWAQCRTQSERRTPQSAAHQDRLQVLVGPQGAGLTPSAASWAGHTWPSSYETPRSAPPRWKGKPLCSRRLLHHAASPALNPAPELLARAAGATPLPPEAAVAPSARWRVGGDACDPTEAFFDAVPVVHPHQWGQS
eukprot:CAMPEP_0204356594 /NCGR_PEP_ID=MMETSP0469-20131031/35064_1 /ASSEMBLY_ACC=CAM_ASM_000384 /TAXON_ID=2969 /ORGANISM="Oxyrrhis marina" /LENGTH=187 /DNA_ID=CAMNT_0051344083 /DNA_START=92 /DNA_END=656 /DNA_ORIENTATION=+